MKFKLTFSFLAMTLFAGEALAQHPSSYLPNFNIHLASTASNYKLNTRVFVCTKKAIEAHVKYLYEGGEGCQLVAANEDYGPKDFSFNLFEFYKAGLVDLGAKPEELVIYIEQYTRGQRRRVYISPLDVPLRTQNYRGLDLPWLDTEKPMVKNSIYATFQHPIEDQRFAYLKVMSKDLRRDSVLRKIYQRNSKAVLKVSDSIKMEVFYFLTDSMEEWSALSKISSAKLDLNGLGSDEAAKLRETSEYKALQNNSKWQTFDMFVAIYRKNLADILANYSVTDLNVAECVSEDGKPMSEQEKYFKYQNDRQKMEDFVHAATGVAALGEALISEVLGTLH